MRRRSGVFLCLSLIGLLAHSAERAWADDRQNFSQEFAKDRVALMIGRSDYSAFPLPSATSDAALVAETLQQAGFDVESGVDLPGVAIVEQLSAFIDKINLHGSDTTAVVYISGRFAQINGENLMLPVGARITRAADVAVSGFNIKTLLDALASVSMRACVIMIDASAPPESLAGERTFAPGLAIVDPPTRVLLSYNQNPGMALTEQAEKPGHFAKAFLTALQQPVTNFPDLFKAIRVRIYDDTRGLQRSWETSKLEDSTFSFFPSKEGAPSPVPVVDVSPEAPVASLPREEAYKKVIALDTMKSYQSFIRAFPDDAALPNIQYNLAVRREAEVWAEALRLDTPEAYWTYIKTYPDGGNVGTARARLARLGSTATQPDDFVVPAGFTEIPPALDQGEIIASSASMPISYLPQPPAMQLPPIAANVVAAVAAAAAVRVALGVGARAVPTIGHAPMHPAWAAPVVSKQNRQFGLSGLTSASTGMRPTGPAGAGLPPEGTQHGLQAATPFTAPVAPSARVGTGGTGSAMARLRSEPEATRLEGVALPTARNAAGSVRPLDAGGAGTVHPLPSVSMTGLSPTPTQVTPTASRSIPGALPSGSAPAPASMSSAAPAQPSVRPLNAPATMQAVTPLAAVRTAPSSLSSSGFSPAMAVNGVPGAGVRPGSTPMPMAAGGGRPPAQSLGQFSSAATARPVAVPGGPQPQAALTPMPAARSAMGGLANTSPSAFPPGNGAGVNPALSQRGFPAPGMTTAPRPPVFVPNGAPPSFASPFSGRQVPQPAMQQRQERCRWRHPHRGHPRQPYALPQSACRMPSADVDPRCFPNGASLSRRDVICGLMPLLPASEPANAERTICRLSSADEIIHGAPAEGLYRNGGNLIVVTRYDAERATANMMRDRGLMLMRVTTLMRDYITQRGLPGTRGRYGRILLQFAGCDPEIVRYPSVARQLRREQESTEGMLGGNFLTASHSSRSCVRLTRPSTSSTSRTAPSARS